MRDLGQEGRSLSLSLAPLGLLAWKREQSLFAALTFGLVLPLLPPAQPTRS